MQTNAAVSFSVTAGILHGATMWHTGPAGLCLALSWSQSPVAAILKFLVIFPLSLSLTNEIQCPCVWHSAESQAPEGHLA